MQSAPSWLWVPIALVGFVGFFAGMWTLVSALIANFAGWSTMTAQYPAPPNLQGTPLSSGGANRVGVARYRGVMSFEATSKGLLVRVARLFPFHPPLLLPWQAIELTPSEGQRFAGVMTVAGGSTFSLNRDAFESIQRARDHALSPKSPT